MIHPFSNLPNFLTYLRIFLIPFIVLVFYLPWEGRYLAAGIIFSLAGITDWLDGYLARKLQQTSRFGAFLDPVADKLIVIVALVLLVESYNSLFLTIPALVIMMREVLISALREWMAEMGQRTQVAVSSIGKWKTTFQIIAIIDLLAFPFHVNKYMTIFGYVMLYAAAFLTLWSMFVYLKAAYLGLREEGSGL